MNNQSFSQKCYSVLCQVPRGRVTTYRAIAEALGSNGYRAVGQAMNRNPNAPRVPCHRVVGSDGSLTGYAGGLKRKVAILKREGVKVSQGKIENFKAVFFKPRYVGL